jgi:nicotinate-nucleotide pyrophosphorylase
MHIITDALPILAPELVTRLVGDALAEDWQTRGDVTSQAVIPATAQP